MTSWLEPLRHRTDDRQHPRPASGCCAGRRSRSPPPRRSAAAPTPGTRWDGDLREYNNPLPKWWLWLFYITVVFGAGLPRAVPGPRQLRRASRAGRRRRSTSRRAPPAEATRGRATRAVRRDDRAGARGQRPGDGHGATTCSRTTARSATARTAAAPAASRTCANADWQWGGDPDSIVQTIADGRIGRDDAVGRGARRARASTQVVAYVQQLSGQPADAAQAAAGATHFQTYCVGLPRRGRQGHGRGRRAQPDRRRLAVRRRRRRRSSETVDERPHGPDAGVRGQARRAARAPAGRLRPEAVGRRAVASHAAARRRVHGRGAVATPRAGRGHRHLAVVPRGERRDDDLLRLHRPGAGRQRRLPAARLRHADVGLRDRILLLLADLGPVQPADPVPRAHRAPEPPETDKPDDWTRSAP
ncbi:MAG: hypothetical protein MZW92_15910 [Comamonadaceae bacterium]|nr:hypothetical protein [Comamonadaceae bacterium]